MNTLNIIDKKVYLPPVVQTIKLDSEISLNLESTPPNGPSETHLKLPESYLNNPLNA
jgi:hypothetical protein